MPDTVANRSRRSGRADCGMPGSRPLLEEAVYIAVHAILAIWSFGRIAKHERCGNAGPRNRLRLSTVHNTTGNPVKSGWVNHPLDDLHLQRLPCRASSAVDGPSRSTSGTYPTLLHVALPHCKVQPPTTSPEVSGTTLIAARGSWTRGQLVGPLVRTLKLP